MHISETFRLLHRDKEPLLLANVWDAHSAKLAEKTGYKAIGTSSHAIANSLGYEDGEKISFDELYFVVKHIVNAVNIPVSVDFEAGYSDSPGKVAEYVEKLADIGIAGINLEDGKVRNGKRELNDVNILSSKINAVKTVSDIFVNARIDTYTTKHNNSISESVVRAKAYKSAGADGVFIPLIEKVEDLKSFIEQIDLPLNVFTTSKLPDYDILQKLGVKRISHGAKQYELLMEESEKIFADFLKSKKYKLVLGE